MLRLADKSKGEVHTLVATTQIYAKEHMMQNCPCFDGPSTSLGTCT